MTATLSGHLGVALPAALFPRRNGAPASLGLFA
jgi:hypothetical protein